MSEDNLPGDEAVKACGESAIILWQNQGVAGAFKPLYAGAEILLNSKNNNENWKSLAVMYAHLCAYLSSVAVTGKPPESTIDPEIYTIPAPGLLLNYSDDIHKYYRDPVDLFIQLQLLLYAEAINLDKEATDIALGIFEMNNSPHRGAPGSGYGIKNRFNLIKAGNNLIPYLIAAERYNEAIRLSLSSSLYLFAMKVIEKIDISLKKPESEADLKNILNNESDIFRREIDKSAVIFSLIPIMLKLGNTCIFDQKLAEQQSYEIAVTCYDIAGNSYFPELWISSADIIKATFNGSYSFKDLLDMGDKYSQENNYILKHICLLGATFQKDIIPENTIFTHIIIFQELVRSLISFPFLYKKIAVPFFKNYWEHKFNNNRFRFISPFYVQSQLESAFKLPPDKIIQKILYIIITSLNIKFDRAYINCLNTD